MRWPALVVALLVLLSGCNALAGGGTPTERDTVSPVPVPTVTTQPTPATDRPGSCVAPKAQASERTPPSPPATPRSLPTVDGTGSGTDANTALVDGARLVALHGEALRNHSYRIDAGSLLQATVLPHARAFSYRGYATGTYFVTAYAVAGSLFLRVRSPNGTVSLGRKPYPPGSANTSRYVPELTGQRWLASVVGPYDYRVVGTRTWNGTEVRVLRATLDTPTNVSMKRILDLNSTLYVDRWGIVRRVDHHERFSYVFEPDDDVQLRDASFAVTNLDAVRLRRPDAFCGVQWDEVRLDLPGGSLVTPTAGNATTPDG